MTVKRDAAIVSLVVALSALGGTYLGWQDPTVVYPHNPEIVYPQPIYDEDNFTVGYGDHWTEFMLISNATQDVNIKMIIAGTTVFNDALVQNQTAIVIVVNATGDQVFMILSYEDGTNTVSVCPEVLTDKTTIEVRIFNNGLVNYSITGNEGVPIV